MRCYAFTDESDNTGLNLFDTDQESFWSGTLIAFVDIDAKYMSIHKELLTLACAPELPSPKLIFDFSIDQEATREVPPALRHSEFRVCPAWVLACAGG